MITFDEEKFKEKLAPILSTPIVFSLKGHPKRKDFLYVSTEKNGIPIPFWWKGENDIKQLSEESMTGLLALHAEKPLVIIKKDIGGSENYSIYLFDFSGEGALKQITKNPIGSISDAFWIDDEHFLIIGFNEVSYFVKKINLDGQMVDIFTTNEQVLNSDYDTERKLLAMAIGRRYTKIAIIDIKDSKVKSWIKLSDNSSCNFPAFSSKGQLAYASDLNSVYDEIVIQSEANPNEHKKFKVPGFVGFWPFDKGAIQWIDEENLSVYVGKNGRMSLYLLDIKNNLWTEIVPSDLSLGKAIVTSDGIVWYGSSFKQPEIFYRFRDSQNNRFLDWSKEQLKLSIENHWYESFDGRKVQAWLVKNPNPEAPLLVYCHGGPTYANIDEWDIYLTSFVIAGFNVFAPNFRGSTTFGTEFKNLTIGESNGDDLKDVLFGAKYAQKILNSDRLPLIFGASHGGYLTLRALTTQPDDWLGGVAWVPMADLKEAYGLANSHYRLFLEHFLGGSPYEKPDLYKELSPITFVANLKAPLFIYHGANDSRCPVISVRRFYEEAKKRNLPVELIVAGDEGHGSVDVGGFFEILKLSVKHLLSLL
ncbi:MAG TPA: prolyl oligopeptidase family serine peptidase [Candidatus Bathyarchaeia archaeon]|nr:prolyl oligopeptidase family serine peptidase [Candidatus Bathyarchaeia archaeon]